MTNNNDFKIKAGVVGFPIEHSLSPVIHNFYLNTLKINGYYDKYSIPIDNFEQSIKNLILNEKLQGFNITIPHKERILALCDHLSNTAKNIGAVNTVKILENGKIYGHNSDGEGFIKNLTNQIPKFNFKNCNCLVIGAGGASRAIIYSLIKMQVAKIFISNRTTKNIYKIIEDFKNLSALNKVEIIPIELSQLKNFITNLDLIVNSSPLGMHGQPPLELDLSIAKKNTVIYDIVYKPLMTKLLIDAKKNNLPIVTGIGMLIEQAIIGFEMWFGQKPQYNYELEKKLIEIANL